MKKLGTIDGFKDTDIVLQDVAEEDTQNKFYFVFLVKTADKQSKVFCTTDYNESKKFDENNDKAILASYLWRNSNASTDDNALDRGFCSFGKECNKAVVLYYDTDRNTVIDDDMYFCETKETMDNIVKMHKGIADEKIVTLGKRLKFVS